METENNGGFVSDENSLNHRSSSYHQRHKRKEDGRIDLKMLEQDHDLYLKPTEFGFHVCMKLTGEIKLVQIWGRLTY